jgi:hypothetical protein
VEDKLELTLSREPKSIDADACRGEFNDSESVRDRGDIPNTEVDRLRPLEDMLSRFSTSKALLEGSLEKYDNPRVSIAWAE